MPQAEVDSFLIGLGFKVDTASKARFDAAVADSEQKAAAAAEAGSKKRVAAEEGAMARRTAIMALFGKTAAAEAEKDERRQADAARRASDRRKEGFKQAEQQFYRLASLAIKTTAFFEVGKVLDRFSLGLVSRLDQAAAGFERLGYASKRVGASVGGITALGYAVSQTGGTAQAAQSTLEAFGERMRINPQGYRQSLERIGVQTRGQDGRPLGNDMLLMGLGQRMAEISKRGPFGYANAIAEGKVFGIEDEDVARSLMDPETRRRYAEQRAQQRRVGADPDATARSGAAVEVAMRRLRAVVDAVATRIDDVFFQHVRPRLDDLAKWIESHGKAIGDITGRIIDAVAKVAGALLKSDAVKAALDSISSGLDSFAAYVGTDQFKKDVKEFAAGIGNIAKALLNAIKYISNLIGGGKGSYQDGQDPNAPGPFTRMGSFWQGGNTHIFRSAILRGRESNTMRGEYRKTEKLGRFLGAGPRALNTDQQRQNAAAIADELRKAGVPNEGIAAVLGSMQTESTFNPRAHNDVTGGHTGLWQWDRTRWPKVEAWIRSQGGDPFDPRWQTRAYMAEGRAKPGDALYDTSETSAGFQDVMGSRGDLGRAVTGVRRSERYGIGEEGGRAANAGKWLQNLPGTPTAAAPPSGGSGPVLPLPGSITADQYQATLKLREEINARFKRTGRFSDDDRIAWAKSSDILDAWKVQQARAGQQAPTPTPGAALPAPQGLAAPTEANYLAALRRHDRRTPAAGDDAIIKGWEAAHPSPAPRHPPVAPEPQSHANTRRLIRARLGMAAPWMGTDFGHKVWGAKADSAIKRARHSSLVPTLDHPLGITPSMYASYDNSRTRGDVAVTDARTFNIHGGDTRMALAEARRMPASRGHADVLRNLQSMES